jgi:Aspartyl protease
MPVLARHSVYGLVEDGMRFHPRLVLVILVSMMPAHAKSQAPNAMPFKLKQSHFIVVEGTLGELTGRNFVIDTGVAPTMIDTAIAGQLGLSGEQHAIHAVMYDIDTIEMSLSHLTLGPIHLEGLRVVAKDLSGLSKKIGVRVDALVGLDVFGHSSFTIDYTDETIRFGAAPPSANQAALVQEKFMVTVEMMVGQAPMQMLVDTGAGDIILFRNRIDIVSPASEIQHNKSNLGGKLVLTRVPAPTLQLGRTALDPEWAFLVDDPSIPVTMDGLLGVSPQFFDWIAFDFERRLFSWQVRDPRIPPITEAGSARCPSAGDSGSMSWAPANVPNPCQIVKHELLRPN